MGQDFSSIVYNEDLEDFKRVGFSDTQIKCIRQKFKDKCKNGTTMSKADFANMLGLSLEASNPIFEYIDMDKNGTIDDYEFICGLALFTKTSPETRLTSLFNLFDADRTQLLEAAEFKLMIRVMISCSNIGSKDTKAAANINTVVDATYKELVQNYNLNNGSLTLADFKKMAFEVESFALGLVNVGVLNIDEFGGDDFDADLENEIHRNDANRDDEYNDIKTGEVVTKKSNITKEGIFEVEEVEEGEQFMAVKPWVGTLRANVPSGYQIVPGNNSPPDTTLKLDYIHGYRCHDTRNNLKYNSNGHVVYHTAGVGILMDPSQPNKQQFLMDHSDDILCLDVFENLVVTGEMGKKPILCLWDSSSTPTPLSIQMGVIQNTIAQVAFSNDGKRIAVSSMDNDKTIYIYDVDLLKNGSADPKFKNQALLLKGKGPKDDLFDLKFDPTNQQLLAGAKSEFYFLKPNGNLGFKVEKGKGWAKANQIVSNQSSVASTVRGTAGASKSDNTPLSTLCIAVLGNNIVTGASKNLVIRWSGSTLTQVFQHSKNEKGFVFCINSRPKNSGILSGSSDGTVVLWNDKMEKDYTITINSAGFKSLNPKLRSVAEHKDGRVLVGTRASEVIEFSNKGQNRKVLNKGHFDHELWGLSHVAGEDHTFLTCGEDFLFAKWDAKSNQQLAQVQLKYQAKTIDCNIATGMIAIGCKNGIVCIYDKTLKPMAEIADRKKEVSIVKFSPDGKYLAVGGHDTRTYVYPVTDSRWKAKGILTGHHSTILHIDWSKDSSVIVTNSQDYEIIFWNVENCKQDTRGGTNHKDTEWATFTCKIAWASQGIWPAFSDGSDVNAVCRGPLPSDFNPKKPQDTCNRTILATADDFGLVKLFKYPCVQEKSDFIKYSGHSSHVTNVNFINKGKRLISTGGNDKAIFVWKVNSAQEEDVGEHEYDLEQYDQEELEGDQEGIENGVKSGPDASNEKKSKGEDLGIFQMEEVEEGEQFMAVKPFEGQVRAMVPTGFKPGPRSNEAPTEELKLKYIHGYRCFDCKNTAKWTKDNTTDVVFVSAALGVKMNTAKRPFTQQFFNMHDEDLICFDTHPTLNYACSGQMAAKGKSLAVDIFVWDCDTMQVVSHLVSKAKGSICQVKFSNDGEKLLSIRTDENNSVSIWDWKNQRLISTAKVDAAAVIDICWDQFNNNQFVSVGPKHVKFWSCEGANLNAAQGKWKGSSFTDGKALPLISCTMVKNVAFTGTCVGTILAWQGSSIIQSVKGHEGNVFVLHYSKQRNTIISGCAGGKIIEWTLNSNKLGQQKQVCNMKDHTPFIPSIKSIDTHLKTGDFLIGTKASELYILKASDTTKPPKCIMHGHFEVKKPKPTQVPPKGEDDHRSEVWGLAVSPSDGSTYVTSGGDFTIRLWSATEKWMKKYVKLEQDVRALDWSSSGKYIVAGGCMGMIYLFDGELNELDRFQSKFNVTKHGWNQWIEDIKISPDEKMIAFGAHSGLGFQVLKISGGKIKPHIYITQRTATSGVHHLDWAVDSSMIIINDLGYNLLIHSVADGSQVKASSCKDEEWYTWTCILGFPVQGIFPGIDGTDVNTVDRAANKKILATGDDFQKVNLFKYPSTQKKSGCKSFIGHASHVTGVKFMMGDNALISTGGHDKTNILWTTSFGDQNHPTRNMLMNDTKDGEAGDSELIEENFNPDEDTYNDEEYDLLLDIVEPKIIRDKYSIDKLSTNNSTTAGGSVSNGESANIFQSLPAEENAFDGEFKFEMEEVAEAEEFMAVKPWKGQIRPPTNFAPPKGLDQTPDIELKLQYVHGYRSKDMRNNIFYNAEKQLVWQAAAVAIIHNTQANTQTHYFNHDDDIISITKHPNNKYFATGEIGPKPRLAIWDSTDPSQTVMQTNSWVDKGVSALGFSPDGSKLAACCMDEKNKVNLFDVSGEEFKSLWNKEGGNKKYTEVIWFSEAEFVAFGPDVFKVWSVDKGSSRNSLPSKSKDKVQWKKENTILCGHAYQGETQNRTIYCGNAAGQILVYSPEFRQKQDLAKAGKSFMLNAIHVTKDVIISGGSDFKIRLTSRSDLKQISSVDISSYAPNTFNGVIKAIAVSEDGQNLAVGLHASEIVEIKCLKKLTEGIDGTEEFKTVVQGHYAKTRKTLNEVWGLTTLSDDDHYITVGDDGTIRLWSSKERKMKFARRLDVDMKGLDLALDKATGEMADTGKLRSVDISPDDKLIAVGSFDGTVRILTLDTKKKDKMIELSLVINKRKRWIQDLKFSPNGQYLAVSSHDSVIDFFKVSGNKLISYWSMNKHTAFVTHIDWSCDSSYIHSNCANYEILYSNVEGKFMDTKGRTSCRDMEWQTWTCIIGWDCEGIFRTDQKGRGWDGSDINKTDRSNTKFNGDSSQGIEPYRILATADDFSKLRLYRYPCIFVNSGYLQADGHSSHVTNVKWSKKDTFVYSTGGEDQCVFQWKERSNKQRPSSNYRSNNQNKLASKNQDQDEAKLLKDKEEEEERLRIQKEKLELENMRAKLKEEQLQIQQQKDLEEKERSKNRQKEEQERLKLLKEKEELEKSKQLQKQEEERIKSEKLKADEEKKKLEGMKAKMKEDELRILEEKEKQQAKEKLLLQQKQEEERIKLEKQKAEEQKLVAAQEEEARIAKELQQKQANKSAKLKEIPSSGFHAMLTDFSGPLCYNIKIIISNLDDSIELNTSNLTNVDGVGKVTQSEQQQQIELTKASSMKSCFARVIICVKDEFFSKSLTDATFQLTQSGKVIYSEVISASLWKNVLNSSYDVGVIKLPESVFVNIGLMASVILKSDEKLNQLKKLGNFVKTSNSGNFKTEQILGFDAPSAKKQTNGDIHIPKQTCVSSLEKYTIEGCEDILDAFKVESDKSLISLHHANTKLEVWIKNIKLFDSIPDPVEEGEDEYQIDDEEF